MQHRTQLFRAIIISAIVSSVVALAHAAYAAPNAPAVTLTVNSSADTEAPDSYLTLRQALKIARGTLPPCLSDTEITLITGVTFGGGPGCHTITSFISSSWIVFSGALTVSPQSALPSVPCNTWLSSDKTTARTVTVDGTSAGAVDGLTLDCNTTATSSSVVEYLTIQNFSGNGIKVSGVHTATLVGLSIHNNTGNGIYLTYSTLNSHNARGNQVGTPAGSDRNYIYSNGQDGVHLEGNSSWDSSAMNNRIENSYVGLDAGGAAHANAANGIHLSNAWNNYVGGTISYGYGNVISGNSNSGIRLDNSSAYNQVYGNTIGLNAAGTAKMPNAWTGVSLLGGANNNTIGNDNDRGNTIAGNSDNGIDIYGVNNNHVYANRIGTNVSSASGLGNTNAGVRIRGGAQLNYVGSELAGYTNIISGNGGPGIGLDDPGTSSNMVLNNYIGTNAAGTEARPNSIGIRFTNQATNNTIGSSLGRNVISGNSGPGVGVYGSGTSNNTITYNYLGINAAGTAALPNAYEGVIIQEAASSNTITHNVISGNTLDGVNINGSGTTGNTVESNYIGLNAAGTLAIPNGASGVYINGANANRIGQAGSVTQYISGNTSSGIKVANANGTQILSSNAIGVAPNKTTATGNGSAGILLDGATNTVVLADTIANNGGAGVAVIQTAATGNRINPGTIKSNGGLPIDLGNNGFTANDAGDTDAGPNTLLNYPVITVYGDTVITGTACANCWVYTYQAVGNPSAPGGGGIYKGNVLADSSGNWSWTLSSGLKATEVSSVACQSPCDGTGGNTSEMSPATSFVYVPLLTKDNAPSIIPAAPGPITVTVLTTSTINVAWKDNSATEEGFRLEQKTGSGSFTPLPPFPASVGTGVVITTITGLSPSTNYTFRVQAYAGSAYSSYSNSASGTTPSNLALPAAPSNLTATGIEPDLIELSWLNNANNANWIDIDLSEDGGAHWWKDSHGGVPYGTVSVDFTTVWDDARLPSTQYCYHIRARNEGGASAWTATACGTTPALPAVNAPTNLTATLSTGTNVTLTWNDNSSNEDGFRLETLYNGGAYNATILPVTMTVNATSVTIAEPNASASYKYRIRAFNVYATSSWSNEPTVTIPAASLTGAKFTNNTSYYVVSLIVDGIERLEPNASGAIAPSGSLQIPLAPGSHTYSAITGNYSGSIRNDLWHYPGGSNSFNVTAGSVFAVPPFTNPTITQLLSNPEGVAGRTYTVWMAQTGSPYVNVCFKFNNDGTYQFRGTSGYWSGVSSYWLVSYPGNFYVTFQPAGYPYGYLSETSITQSFANPFFDMNNGPNGSTYRYEYTATNTCY